MQFAKLNGNYITEIKLVPAMYPGMKLHTVFTKFKIKFLINLNSLMKQR